MDLLVNGVVLFPILGFLIINILRKDKCSKASVHAVALSSVALAFLASLYLFLSLQHNELQAGISISCYTFLESKNIQIHLSWMIDALSLMFMLVITGIGFLIHLFSTIYMKEEKDDHYARYFSYLNLFVFFMLVLVMGGNLILTFVGWEGVGLCSYLLIGYWYKKDEYVGAANKAFIMNRIGDLAFLMASFLCVYYFGTLDYKKIESLFTLPSEHLPEVFGLSAIGFLLFFAATGKSAQIPLFTWLPDAMAGPTPVSALLHAATMVTAGIYLISRFYFLINLTPEVRELMLIVGTLTAFLAATVAVVQKDIKKVLAYSTVSQLGFMVVALGLGAYSTAVFHVFTHAFFKALLFLGAGSIIYALHHEQRMSHMGGLKKLLPITHLTFIMACLGIAGIPPFAGFFSKDEILIKLFEHNVVIFVIIQATALLTTFYMFRAYTLVFLGEYRGKIDIKKIHEGSPSMTIPLIILAVGVVIVGWLGMSPLLTEWLGGENLLEYYLAKWNAHEVHHMDHQTELYLTIVATSLSLVVIIIAMLLFNKKTSTDESSEDMQTWKSFLFEQWKVDQFYEAMIVKPLGEFSKKLFYLFDLGIMRNIPGHLEALSMMIGSRLQMLQSGLLSSYLAWMMICIFLILLFVVLGV